MELKMRSNLRRMREDKNLSVNKLSKLTGVPRLTIDRIEDEEVKELPIKFLQRLCIYFQCDLTDIIYFEKVA